MEAPAEAGAQTTSVSGKVSTFAAGNNETPVAGATICVLDEREIPCTTSGVDGMFTLAGMPTDVRAAISVAAKDHVTAIVPAVVPAGIRPFANVDMVSNEIGAAVAPSVGITWPLADTAQVTFYAKSAAAPHGYVPGASFALVKGTAKGIFYAADDESLDASRTSTSSAGWGVIGNVVGGETSVRYSHPTLDCGNTSWGWPNADGSMDLPVRAGMLTFVLAWCG